MFGLPIASCGHPITLMVAEWLQKLLILQDRDSICDGIQSQLEDIPRQISAEESNIRQLGEQLSQAEEAVKLLEVKRLDLDGQVDQTKATIVKYKTQQMQVKKNEEYTALDNEIKALQDKVSALEDDELLLMEEIDEAKAALETTRESIANQKATLEAHIVVLKKNHAASESELGNARAALAECETKVDDSLLEQYRYVKSQMKRPPVVVPLEDSRCQGCHLKVSGEVESVARRGKELARCDSCGRILYFDR